MLESTMAKLAGNTGMVLNLALSYGGRLEIVDAARRIAVEAAAGRLRPEDLDEQSFGAFLYQPGLPEPDFLIRTSGEQRISNFLLWQLAYSELYFTDTLWPDFDVAALDAAIVSYRGRERRFGRTSDQVEQAKRAEVA